MKLYVTVQVEIPEHITSPRHARTFAETLVQSDLGITVVKVQTETEYQGCSCPDCDGIHLEDE